MCARTERCQQQKLDHWTLAPNEPLADVQGQPTLRLVGALSSVARFLWSPKVHAPGTRVPFESDRYEHRGPRAEPGLTEQATEILEGPEFVSRPLRPHAVPPEDFRSSLHECSKPGDKAPCRTQ